MNIKTFSELLSRYSAPKRIMGSQLEEQALYRPTPYLSHPFLQSIYNLAEPVKRYEYQRERIFFDDGGHISLDWCSKQPQAQNPPILFIMHGLTGGSEMNYIKALMHEASLEGYKSVCMNSRGINSNMTSPIPFTACEHGELEAALDRVEHYYPNSPIYMVGTSFGGNYLMRYLSKFRRNSIQGLIALAPPIDVKTVVKNMPFVYQHFFVKRYIYQIVTKHPQMNFWGEIGVCDMKKIKKSRTLQEFHFQATCKIIGLESTEQLFEMYSLSNQDIASIKVPTYMMLSRDDPIVSFESMPLEVIGENKQINLVVTDKGGHLCWFEGMIPKRWYPRPALDYLKSLSRNHSRLDEL